jgi:restriction system protein
VTPQAHRTIVDAIVEVLRSTDGPMTAEEITEAIKRKHLYNFKAAEPAHIVSTQIRRHTDGLSLRAAADTKRFLLTQDGRYGLIDKGHTAAR